MAELLATRWYMCAASQVELPSLVADRLDASSIVAEQDITLDGAGLGQDAGRVRLLARALPMLLYRKSLLEDPKFIAGDAAQFLSDH